MWEPEVKDAETWLRLSVPVRNAEFSKFVIDIKTGKMYFIDSHVFTLHSDFVLDYLLKMPRTRGNMLAYNQNYNVQKPAFILGYLTHYAQLDEWAFSFWEGDAITPKDISKTAKLLKQNFTISNLKFRPDSSKQELVAKQLKRYKIAVIYNKSIYQNSPFQSFNVGAAVGQLNIVPKGNRLDEMQFAPSDIVILQQAYPDISPVSGIITTHGSTPLAHVNLRANAWGIPNANLKTAAQDYAKWDKQWVALTVTEQGLQMHLASTQAQKEAQAKVAVVNHVDLLQADIAYKNLDTLAKITLQDVLKFGAKTAHLGEMQQAGMPVPDGFGIPFYYYLQHMQKNGLDVAQNAMLADKRFYSDAAWRKQQLLDFQAKSALSKKVCCTTVPRITSKIKIRTTFHIF